MKEYFKNYNEFTNETPTNEGILDKLKAATGAVKNFLTGLAAPFKNFKDDYKKGLSMEESKSKFTKTLDQLAANTIKSINAAKEKSEILQMEESFRQQLDEQMAAFDKEISSVKESNMVNEGKIQDALIGGRVLFGLIKDEFARFSEEFSKRLGAAKTIAEARNVAISSIKNAIAQAKKNISNPKLVDQAVSKYKEEKGIEVTEKADKSTIVLNWGDNKEMTIKPSEEKKGFYQILSTNSTDINLKEGEKLFAKVPPSIENGKEVQLSELERNGAPDKLGTYTTGAIKMIKDPDGKEIPRFDTGVAPEDTTKKAQEVLGKLKGNDDKISKVTKFAEFIQNDANKDKIDQIDKIMSESFFQTNFGTFIRG